MQRKTTLVLIAVLTTGAFVVSGPGAVGQACATKPVETGGVMCASDGATCRPVTTGEGPTGKCKTIQGIVDRRSFSACECEGKPKPQYQLSLAPLSPRDH
jgi:hypothetical protein